MELPRIFFPPRYITLSILASIGGMLFGLDTGTIGPITSTPSFLSLYGTNGHISSTLHGLIVSSILPPAALASFFAGLLSDALGRPRAMSLGALIFSLGATLEASSIHLAMLFIGRCITGIGEGLFLSTVSVYVIEIAPANGQGRGVLSAVPQLMITIGTVVGYFFSYGMVRVDGPGGVGWRASSALRVGVGLVWTLICVLSLTDTPRWLKMKGREEEAIAMWDRLGAGVEAEGPEMREMRSVTNVVVEDIVLARTITPVISVQGRPDVKQGYRALLRVFQKDVRSRTLLGVFIMGMQQLSGIDGVLYYAPLLFSSAGLSSIQSSFLASGISALLIFVVTVPAILLSDHWSRRASILIGGALLATCMLLIGVLYASDAVQPTHGGARWAVIALIYIFAVVFSVTWAISMRIYATECQPLRTRAAATGLAQTANWVVNWVVAFTTPIFLARSSSGVYFLFGGSCVLTVVVCWLYMPETRGRTLEEIDEGVS